MRFIDRSNVNGKDNYRTAGVGYLYLKATQGDSFVDATMKSRMDAAKQDGVKIVGVYHFADHNDAVAECEHFLSVAPKPAPGQFRECLDVETGQSVAWVEAWVNHFKAHRGYLPVIYGSTSVIGPMRAASKIIRSCPWWRAEYGPDNGHLYPLVGGAQGATAHQYTSKAEFSGISGYTDASVFCRPAGPMLVSRPRHPVSRISRSAWEWAQWFLSIGKYKNIGRWQYLHHRKGAKRDPFKHVPKGGYRAARWYAQHVLRRKPVAPPPPKLPPQDTHLPPQP